MTMSLPESGRKQTVAGLTDVVGNGVIVYLADAPQQYGGKLEYYVVHDVEIMEV